MIVGFDFRQPPAFEVRVKKVQLRKNNFSKNEKIVRLFSRIIVLPAGHSGRTSPLREPRLFELRRLTASLSKHQDLKRQMQLID